MSNPVTHFQILSKSPEQTAQFYASLFGWTIGSDNPMGYRRIDTGSGLGIQGGIWPAPPQAPNLVQLFVKVDDVAEAITRAQALGASVIIPATRLPEGEQMAVLLDPQGMPFAVTEAPSR